MKIKVIKGAVDYKDKRYIQGTKSEIFDAPDDVAKKLIKKGVCKAVQTVPEPETAKLKGK